MTSILIRTLFFYIILTLMFKLMGKRQIGQLQMTEFATAVILSEAAALPITNSSIPISHGLVPLLTLACLEIIASFMSSRSPKLRKLLDGSPVLLVAKGEILHKNFGKTRITLDEVFSEIRLQGYTGLEEVQYVILESSGKMSVIPKSVYDALTPDDIGKAVPERGVSVPIIIEGKINEELMADINLDEKWLGKILKKNDVRLKQVLYLTVNDAGTIQIVRRDKKDKESKDKG